MADTGPVLTPQLIHEAVESPNAETLESPPTDPQAARQLPHDELDRSEALSLLSSVFGAQVESPAGIFDEMQVERFLSDHVAVMPADALGAGVTESDEEASPAQAVEPTLVESSVPLRTEDSEGNEAPVDLSLESSEGELQPTNPLVETGIPMELGEGVSLANADIKLEFPEAVEERAPSTVEGDAAFYPNVQADTDLLVAPTTSGVETLTQLRTPEAPRTETVHLDLPEGTVLKEADAGGAEATLNDHTLLTVLPPSAIDAAGNNVPMGLAVSGNTIELTISPTGSNVYPILADPVWQYEHWNWTWENSSLANWTGRSTTASYQALPYTYWDPNHFPGLDLTSGFPGSATSTQGAEWDYYVPRFESDMAKYGERPQSYLNEVHLGGVNFLLHGNSATYPVMIAGIMDTEHGGWVSVGSHSGYDGEIIGWAGEYWFPNYENTDAKMFDFALATLEAEPQAKWRDAFAATAWASIADHNAPHFTKLTGPSGWLNNDETSYLTYSATDPGLGIFEMQLYHPNYQHPWEYKVGCAGGTAAPCPRTYESAQAGSANLAIRPSIAPQGIDSYKAVAVDPLGSIWDEHTLNACCEEPYPHVVEQEVRVKIDHSAPTLSLSGTLTEQASLGTAKPQYALKYSAADGTREAATLYATFGAEGSGNSQFKHPADVALDPSENVWVADQANNRIEKLNVKGEFLAAYGTLGSGNGQLSGPSGIEADEKGNLWVADTGNNRIEEFNSKGGYLAKFGTLGTGSGNLSAPKGIAVAPNGNLWVADTGNNRIEEFSSSGTFIGAFGTKGSGNLQFNEPSALDIGPGGNLWVADQANNRIEKLNEKGEFLAAYGTLGSGNGQFNHPAGIDVDTKGNVYVLDENNGRVEQLSERGEYLTKFGSKGTGSGQFTFSGAAGLTTNFIGEVWITDSGDNRVEEWNPPKGTRSGVRKLVVKMDGKVVQESTVTCPQGGCPLSGEWALHSGEYAVGAHTVEVIATDGVELANTQKLNITLNPPPPSVSLSGTMTEQATLGQTRPRYGLKLNATAEMGTGIAGSARSHVKSEVTVDGKLVDSGEATCSTETCPIAREWSMGSSSYSVGKHTVVAKATDGFGYATTKTLTIEVQRDTTKPTIQLSGELANAPEGWVQQESYGFNATASDPKGYGVTSLDFKIDGSTVASTTNGCPEGACGASISKGISMAAYSGGSHEAEVVATDGAGNKEAKRWTINVDPEGHVSTAEATATMEAVEETSESNVVGPSEEDERVLGTADGLALESMESGFEAQGSAAPMTVEAVPGGPLTVEVPTAADLYGCHEQVEEETGEPVGLPPEEGCVPASEGASDQLQPIEVTQLNISEEAGGSHLVEESAAVSANTESSTDTVVRPLNDGGMIFEAIRDDSAPEGYSFKVELGEEQVLRSVDETHAEVFYSGHLPAFGITAEPAHDAVGTAVPTTLTVDGRDTVTLHVHFKAGHEGQPFVYPVVGGTGWEGGFRTIEVDMDNRPLEEPEESDEEDSPPTGALPAPSGFKFATEEDVGPPEFLSGSAGASRIFHSYMCEWHDAYLGCIPRLYEEYPQLARWGVVQRGRFHYDGHEAWFQGGREDDVHCEQQYQRHTSTHEPLDAVWNRGCYFNGPQRSSRHIIARQMWRVREYTLPDDVSCDEMYWRLYRNGNTGPTPFEKEEGAHYWVLGTFEAGDQSAPCNFAPKDTRP